MGILYRVVWFLAMVLVMAPSFILAGFVDGLSYREAMKVSLMNMQNMMLFPYEMAQFLKPVVAFVAQLLPASSSLAVMAGEMLLPHAGVILAFLFFALVQPPIFKLPTFGRKKTTAETEVSELLKAS
ncbi:hypothetical protein [Pseudomonas sp. PLMAX]|jgi:hypothetical protein|uniref:hypothetical protein n=1 Tax=Pseudomonas sp. PLMAX TaxID=2201998 RepID=UPI0038B7B5A2